jgi:hypothetical protein
MSCGLGACEQDSKLREDLVGLVLSPRQKTPRRTERLI